MAATLVMGTGLLVAAAVPAAATTAAPTEASAPASATATASANSIVPGKARIDRRCMVSGRVLCVNKTTRKIYFLVNGRIYKGADARFGCRSTPTSEGSFRITRKSLRHVSSIYHTSMPWAMFFKGGQAVHYSADFAARGYNGCSHACVNMRSKSAIQFMYLRTKVGDRVIVYRS